jgi:hypothetical protein
MNSWKRLSTNLSRFFLVGMALVVIAAGQPASVNESPSRSGREHLDPLPLAFVPNVGQSAASIAFQAAGRFGALTFSSNEVMLATAANTVLRAQFQGANPAAHISGRDPLPGVVNFYAGSDPARWRSNLPTYGALVYHELYTGIDLAYNGHEGSLKGTYTIAPGNDPDQIRWHYNGADDVALDSATGDLHIELGQTRLIERAPIAWQVRSGVQSPIGVRFSAQADGSFGFKLDQYDPSLPLIIDPTLIYGTYLGADNTDDARGIAADQNGNVYLTGQTYSSNFPGTTGIRSGTTDVFVTKLNAQATTLLFTTILGGNDVDAGNGIAVDATGHVWVTGATESTNFPTLNPLMQANFSSGFEDTFATRLNPNGSLAFSTYLGLDTNDHGNAIAVDGQGNAYITGEADAAFGPEVIAHKLAADGSELIYGRVFGAAERGFMKGSSGYAIAVDSEGNAYITGRTNSIVFPVVNPLQATCREHDDFDCTGVDAFVTKLDPAGDTILYSTYLGGSSMGSEIGTGSDEGWGIAVDGAGNIYVAGTTFAPDFPVVNALQPTKSGADNFSDAFIAKLTPAGDELVYSTYLGGTAWEEAHGLVIDGAGNAYVAGFTSSNNFPVSSDAIQSTIGQRVCIVGSNERFCYDGFVTALSATGSRLWSTYLGGKDDDIINGMAYAAGNVYVAGKTGSFDLPTTAGVFQHNKAFNEDAFVVKIATGSVTPPPPSFMQHVYLPLVLR